MGKIIAFELLTLDGVMQAPGRPDEDLRGGFEHGGWANPYATMETGGKNTDNPAALLVGRRTYEDLYSYWPEHPEAPYTTALNNMQKYVVSTTLKEPLPWSNSTLLKGDIIEAVTKLKEELSGDLLIFGSGELVQLLMQRHLIDEYILMIHPLILGSGLRLFPDGGAFAALQLVDTRTTSTGVLIATYRPARA